MTIWILAIVFVIVFVLVGGSLIWRFASYHVNIPWPYWMAWFLRNPFMLIFANPKEIVSLIEPRKSLNILDVGGGDGRIAIPLAKHIAGVGGKVHLIDLQKGMIRRLKSSIKRNDVDNISFEQADITKASLQPNVYDYIILYTVLGEIPNRSKVLAQLQNALKDDGEMIITEVIPDPCYISRSSLIKMCNYGKLYNKSLSTNLFAYTARFAKAKNT